MLDAGRRSRTRRPSPGRCSSPTGAAAGTGLDAAEVLAEHGLEVTLACAAPCPGETLHQYQRNLYLARLDERGIAILHHTEVTGAACGTSSRGRTSPLPPVATIVYAQGREPEDELWAALEGAPGRVRAGDVLGPRSAEEATLEGVTALQAARAASLLARCQRPR